MYLPPTGWYETLKCVCYVQFTKFRKEFTLTTIACAMSDVSFASLEATEC